MKEKIASILLLAMVCLTGIALVVAQPGVEITSYYPNETNITNTEGAARTFNVTVNQPVNVSWRINATVVRDTEKGVTEASYTNTSAVAGYWNVTAYAYNKNGSDMRTWWWTVTEDTTPPEIVDYAPTGTKVSIKTDITATFNEAMKPPTLNNATIIVCNSSGSTVTGDITYDFETVTFNPVSWLDYNETYNVTITTGVQDLAGNNMSDDFCWHFTTRSEILRTPIVISGKVTKNGTWVLNPDVTITNLDTGENFAVETHPDSCYYRMWTDSTHISAGDMLRFSAIGGEIVIDRNVTETEIANGGFRQDFPPGMPDLVISEKSETFINRKKDFTVSYWVKNTGDEIANASNTTIYVDGVPMWKDPVGCLAPDEQYNNTVGPFERPYDRKNVTIRVCADVDGAVTESIDSNNCLENELECPLPNLRLCYNHGDCKVNGPNVNGRFGVYYVVTTEGHDYVCASNTTINITNVLVNDSVTDISITRNCDALKGDGTFVETVGSYTCACNKEVVVEVCIDGDNRILETDEADNCWVNSFTCPASACKPDLKIVNYSGTWLDRANRTFNVTYTVKNVGNTAANASTTRVSNTGGQCKPPEVIFDRVPALEPGESHTKTVGPFTRLCILHWGEHPAIKNDLPHSSDIIIYANFNKTISESNDKNNQRTFRFGLPHLYIALCQGYWISGEKKTFRVHYAVRNAGDAGESSKETEVRAYIDGTFSKNDTVPSIPIGVTREMGHALGGGIGPLQMPEDKETVNYSLCIVQEDGTEKCTGDVQFGGAACVGKTQRFTVGGAWGSISAATALFITESCKFDGDIYAPGGVQIRANDIVIDGNGSGICGDRSGCGGSVIYDEFGRYLYKQRSGIRNYDTASGHKFRGYDNVTIKNMNIRGYCDGIAIVTADNCRMENCSVHDNGVVDKYSYGINVVNSDNTTIDRCEVYNNTGNLTGMNVCGGHGINFHDDCNYCAVTNSSIFNNYLSGILASPTCKYLYVGNNVIEENGQCNESSFCAGVNLHSKGGVGLTTNSIVENNVILNNTGSGIFVTQSYTTIKDNIVKGSKNGTDVTGNGILIEGEKPTKLTFLYNNTCCESEGMDIVNRGFATFGDDNTCDTSGNYNDDGTTRGCIYKCTGIEACIADDGSGDAYRCGDTVMKSCTFNQNVSCPLSGTGLIAGTDNITINGTGYTLIGNFSGAGIFSNHSGVRIKNLQVKNFFTGIKIENTSANDIQNCMIRKNLRTGINFSADNGTVRNSRIYDNFGPGIFIGGSNNVFENNTAARNKNGTMPGYGIYFSGNATGNNITANFIGDNEAMDIRNDNGATNTGDNNSCDLTYNYWDSSMLEDKKYGCTYPWTMPDLIISNKFEEWVDEENARYDVTYTVENIGAPKSRPAERSTTYLYIRDAHAANDEVGPLKPGENYTNRTFGYTPTIPEKLDKDRIKVYADGPDEVKENNPANKFYCNDEGCYWLEELFELEDHEANNWLENTFSKSGVEDVIKWNVSAVCRAQDGTEYKCGSNNVVKKNCIFTDNMLCPAEDGLIIGRAGITIDGAGYAIGGAGTGSGISNSNSRYNGVTIKNLVITGFSDGIKIEGAYGSPVMHNTIDNCVIFDNGGAGNHGIHMRDVDHSTISNNVIHDNTGGRGTACGSGGDGIFMYRCCDNVIRGNEIYDNRKAGILMKKEPKRNHIIGNELYGNGESNAGTTGGIVLRCMKSDWNTIKNNEVWGNNGNGMFIGGKHNNITDNIVTGNKASGGGFGDGIYMGYGGGTNPAEHTELYGNTVCDNEGMDIRACRGEYGNSGDKNTCDTTEDYNDTGTTNCMYPCSGILMPDLTITELFGAWVKGQEGSTYKVTYTVTNIGTANAGVSTTNLQILEGDNGIDHPVPALKPGDTHTHVFGPFKPVKTSDKITITANAGENRVAESNYDNNEKVKWFPPVLDRIEVSPPTATLKVGETKQFTATAYDQNGDIMEEGIVISWSSSDEAVGDVSPNWGITGDDGNATTVFTADSVGGTTITAESGGISGHAEVTVWFEEPEEPKVPSWFSPGGPGKPSGEENISGFEPGSGEGTGEVGADIGGEQLPVNESETVGGGETRESGHPFGMGGEIIETVKVVAPVFLIALVIIVIVLFYSGYFGEKRAHRRNRRAK